MTHQLTDIWATWPPVGGMGTGGMTACGIEVERSTPEDRWHRYHRPTLPIATAARPSCKNCLRVLRAAQRRLEQARGDR